MWFTEVIWWISEKIYVFLPFYNTMCNSCDCLCFSMLIRWRMQNFFSLHLLFGTKGIIPFSVTFSTCLCCLLLPAVGLFHWPHPQGRICQYPDNVVASANMLPTDISILIENGWSTSAHLPATLLSGCPGWNENQMGMMWVGVFCLFYKMG